MTESHGGNGGALRSAIGRRGTFWGYVLGWRIAAVLAAAVTGASIAVALGSGPIARTGLNLTAPAQQAADALQVSSPNLPVREPLTNLPTSVRTARNAEAASRDPVASNSGGRVVRSPAASGTPAVCSGRSHTFDTSVGSGAPPDTLGGHLMTAFGPDPSAVFSDVNSLADPCPVPGDITFSTPINHRVIGSGWMGWSHGYTGDVYYTNGATSITIALPAGCCAFYFYVEPNPFDIHTLTATTDDGSSTSFEADGSGGAAYCGVYGEGIGSVRISCDVDFAVGEFGIACICDPVYRACCYESTPPATCVDQYDIMACIAEGGRWSIGAEYCSQLNPPCGQYTGACCEGEFPDPGYQPFQCIGEMLQWECLALGEATNWTGGRSCSDPTFLCPGQPGVLYCPSNGDNPAFRTALSALIGLPVDFMNTAYVTPTLETLMNYRAVLTWTNYPYDDSETFGNNLADYVDAGGRVILGQWCLPTAGNYLSGRIMTAEYCPALASIWGPGSYNGDGQMCPTTGVTSLTTDYLDLISCLQSGAMYDGTIGTSYAAIWRPDMAVWYSPGNLGGTYESGDWAVLTYNEIVCPPDMAGACCETTTTTCLDAIQVLDCIAMGAQWKWHMGLCADMVPACGNPGACCDIYTGLCTDDVLEAMCEAEQFTGLTACGELEPACGDPGCCCEKPESGMITEPHFAYRASCVGRFVAQEAGAECVAATFDPACGLWRPTGVLYCPSNGDNSAFRAALSALLGQPVDFVNTANETPTVETMSQYAAVMTWANYPYADNVAFGDNLAAYVDMGGRVILGQWCLPTSSNYLSGRIMTAEYCPALASSWGAGSYNDDGSMCATNGVTTLITSYLDLITGLQPHATWDGTIGASYAAIWRPDMAVWYSPGNLGGTYESGDWALLTYNEIVCANCCGSCCNIYTAECMDGFMAQPCFQMGAGWRWVYTSSCATMDPPCGNPGACCDIYTGECVDYVLRAVCVDQGRQPTGGADCAELSVPCGDPGCCCDRPESGTATPPHEAFRANCEGRFLSGATGEACFAEAFSPACGTWGPTALLWAPTQSEDATFHAALEALLNSDVDYWNSYSQGTPTLEQMLQYAAVATWVDYPYDDAVLMGDTLADYVDRGGRVILGQWTRHSDQRNWLDGRLMNDPAYCPVFDCSTSFGSGAYGMDGVLCPHDGPFGTVGPHASDYVDTVCMTVPGALTDGSIGDSISVVANVDQNVWYSPGLTGNVYGSGDWATKVANMIACETSPGACCNDSTGDCIDGLLPAACMALGPFWRTRPGALCAELVPPCGDTGACCDIYSGGCIDSVLIFNCLALGREYTSGAQCDELAVPCGDPGCCCEHIITARGAEEPYFAFRANCHGEFLAGTYPLCGDLDGSFRVDMIDYNMFLDAYGTCSGQAGFNAAADLDGDGRITLVDFQKWRLCYQFPGPGCFEEMFDEPCGTPLPGPITGPPPSEMCGEPATPFPADPRPLFQDVTTLPTPCAVWGDILFDPAVNHRRIGSGWMNWSHGYDGDVYYCPAFSLTLTMPVDTLGLYFYVEPNPFETHPFTIVVNGTEEGSFEADGSGGAAGVAVCARPIETITISSDIDFAIGEFGIVCSNDSGACCAEWTGECTDGVYAVDCAPVPHFRFIALGTCDEMEPPCGEMRGACCYEEECAYQRPVECFDGGGAYAGDGVPCDPNPCLCADFYIDAPGEWTGSTCGAGDDCALRTGEEVIFAVTIPFDGQWTFSLCGSDFDTYWYFGYECCTQYWSQDDSTECDVAGYTEQQMSAGRYFIDLEGYSHCGNYVLTITPPPLGACCFTDTAECTDGLLEVDCAGDRFTGDTLCADMVPPCGTPCHDAEIVAPGVWSGTTCGALDDCALRAGEDIIVKVEIPADGNWQFGLCGSVTAWDTYMYLGTACCQSTWYDDDGCGTVLSRIQRPGLTAGTYYLDIEPYSSSFCGDLVLDVSSYEPERTAATEPHSAPQRLEQLRP